jgi:hypothetical protein
MLKICSAIIVMLLWCGIAMAASLNLGWEYTPSTHKQLNCTGTFVQLSLVPYPTKMYVDSAIVYNNLYCFKVTAFDNVTQEESTDSNVLRFQMPQEQMAVPQNLKVQ